MLPASKRKAKTAKLKMVFSISVALSYQPASEGKKVMYATI